MWHTQWAVYAITVLGGRRIRIDSIDGVVAWLAEVIGAPAAKRGNGAAVHALPINEFNTVFFTLAHANTHLFEHALLAEKILFVRLALLGCVHLLLAVDKAAEVGLLAPVALVEGASMHRILLWLVIIMIVLIFQSLIT